MDEKLVYNLVTYGLEDLIEKLEIQPISGSTKMFIGQNISSLNTYEYSTRFLGRCFEIDIRQFDAIPSAVVMTTKLHIYIYINLPGQFSNADSKSKVEIKIRNKLFIEVTYEVLKMNFEKSCRKYSHELTYDKCKFAAAEEAMHANLGCAVPHMNSKLPVCSNKSSINQVMKENICISSFIFN